MKMQHLTLHCAKWHLCFVTFKPVMLRTLMGIWNKDIGYANAVLSITLRQVTFVLCHI